MRLCCHQSVLQLNRNHDFFHNTNGRFFFTVTVENPENPEKKPVNETQVISFGENVPNVDIECKTCMSTLHRRVSHNSMIHISSYINMSQCNETAFAYQWSLIQSDRQSDSAVASNGVNFVLPNCPDSSSKASEPRICKRDLTSITTTGANLKDLIIRQGELQDKK